MSGKWEVLSSQELLRAGFFRLRTDRCKLPDERIMPHYYVMEFSDWANIVALTDDNQMILVRQYRHATEEIHLEIPGGGVDPRLKETPQQAAARELLEETGYTSENIRFVAKHRPNPAMQNNFMHTFIATGCRKTHDPKPDAFEDIEVITMPIPEVMDRVMAGEINHSIVVASLLYALPVLGFSVPR